MNLIIPYSGRDFAHSIPILQSIHLRGVEERLSVKTEAKNLFSTSAFSSFVATSLPVLLPNILGKTVWVIPATGKGKSIHGTAVAQGPGYTWWVIQ